MAAEETRTLLPWLARYAGFPRHRLPAHAERLLCFASAAAAEEPEAASTGRPVARRDPARDAALRQHELRRSHAHFKSDNSAKV